jgi:glycosyltransferase involved in cell wall biosynthesis
VVNDGSTDRTFEIARAYSERDARIRALTKPNGGAASARNVAIEIAKGDWVVLLDADDLLLPHCLETYSRFIAENPGYAIYWCIAELIAADGRPTGRTVPTLSASRKQEYAQASLKDMLYCNRIQGAGCTISTSSLRAVGGFNEQAYNEDYELWLRMLIAGYSHKLFPDTLAHCRRTPGSKTKHYALVWESNVRTLEELHELGLFPSHLMVDYVNAMRWLRSQAAIGELQTLVCNRSFSAARLSVFKNRKTIAWTPVNALRVAAVLAVPFLYKRWLER